MRYIFPILNTIPETHANIINTICVIVASIIIVIGTLFLIYIIYKIYQLKDPINTHKDKDIYQRI